MRSLSKLVYNSNKNLDTTIPRRDFVVNSTAISECARIQHNSVKRSIKRHKNRLLRFGEIGHTIHLGKKGRKVKVYTLNEQQATFIITTLQDSEPVLNFKELLVKEFFEMKNELYQREEIRKDVKWVHGMFTDAIECSGEQKRMKGKGFSNYTNLVYKSLFGMSKTEYLRKNSLDTHKSGSLLAYLPREDALRVKDLMIAISGMLEQGYRYNEIKNEVSLFIDEL